MRAVKTIFLVILLAVVSGCVHKYNGIVSFRDETAVSKGLADKTLVEQFKKYWDARAGVNISDADNSGMNIARSFSMEAPFVRDMLGDKKYETYIRLFHKGAEMKSLVVVDVKQTKDFYVTFLFEAVFLKKNQLEKRIINDDWVMVNGKWYHLLKNKLLFPFFEL